MADIISPTPIPPDRDSADSVVFKRPARRRIGGRVLVCILAACIGFRAAAIRGVVFPYRIASGSMAESLVGPHFSVACADCRWTFACGVDFPPLAGKAVCPNCGYADNDVEQGQLKPGERVLIDRLAYAFFKTPRRWDVVAFDTRDRTEGWAVKRIVGLPGERITIEHGDLFAEGTRLKKDLKQLREIALPVHDDAYRSRKLSRKSRWQTERADRIWIDDSGKWEYPGEARRDDATDAGPFDWLVYRHRSGFPGRLRREEVTRIVDNDSYNQGYPRTLQSVSDLLLDTTLHVTGAGTLAFQVTLEDQELRWEWQVPSGDWTCVRGSQASLAAGRGLCPRTWDRVCVEFAHCDRTMLIAVDGRQVLELPCDDVPEGAMLNVSRPVAIGARRVGVVIERLRLLRDVHYLRRPGKVAPPDASSRQATDGYYMLGDNGPISVDSRNAMSRLDRQQIRGQVIRWPGTR